MGWEDCGFLFGEEVEELHEEPAQGWTGMGFHTGRRNLKVEGWRVCTGRAYTVTSDMKGPGTS